ncbi:MAG: hypothetical protein ACXV9R_14270, partial [Methylobacter sp.]
GMIQNHFDRIRIENFFSIDDSGSQRRNTCKLLTGQCLGGFPNISRRIAVREVASFQAYRHVCLYG